MDDVRLERMVYVWSMHEINELKTERMVSDSGMRIRWVNREEGKSYCKWKVAGRNTEISE